MTPKEITFLLTGLIAGGLAVTVGQLRPTVLTVGVGALFFVAILSGIAITRAWEYLRPVVWRYVAAAILCTITYVVALLAFSAVGGYSPDWFGFEQSSDILEFRLDVWLGLVAAAMVASAGTLTLSALLTGRWSGMLLGQLVAAGILAVLVTFLANLPFHHYWSFLGVLLPLGDALFCWLVGVQIWKENRQPMK